MCFTASGPWWHKCFHQEMPSTPVPFLYPQILQGRPWISSPQTSRATRLSSLLFSDIVIQFPTILHSPQSQINSYFFRSQVKGHSSSRKPSLTAQTDQIPLLYMLDCLYFSFILHNRLLITYLCEDFTSDALSHKGRLCFFMLTTIFLEVQLSPTCVPPGTLLTFLTFSLNPNYLRSFLFG